MESEVSRWNFFTNHGHVLFYLQAHPKEPLRTVALGIGITERAVQRIVAELERPVTSGGPRLVGRINIRSMVRQHCATL